MLVSSTTIALSNIVDQELIELPPEETAADILRREAEEAGKRREIIGNIKQEMEELKIVITRIGEELMNQKREKETILRSLNSIGEENTELRFVSVSNSANISIGRRYKSTCS